MTNEERRTPVSGDQLDLGAFGTLDAIEAKAREEGRQLTLALVAEVRRRRDALDPIVAAWQDAGPVPAHHRKAKSALRRDWPALAKAVAAASNRQRGG